MGKLKVVIALVVLLAGGCTPRSTAATTSPTLSSAPSPTPSTASAVQLCFAAPPADWAAAMKKTVATLKGINFGPGAVDDATGIVYGGFTSAKQHGIAAVNLTTGKMTVVSLMSTSESGFAWMSYSDGWLVWSQGESHGELGIWSLQAWNTQTLEKRQLATATSRGTSS